MVIDEASNMENSFTFAYFVLIAKDVQEATCFLYLGLRMLQKKGLDQKVFSCSCQQNQQNLQTDNLLLVGFFS